MAFNPLNLIRWAPNVPSNANTLLVNPLPIAPAPLLPQSWAYNSGNDTIATVEASGYFYYFANDTNFPGNFIQKGDLIYCVCSNGNVQLSVTGVNPITTSATETGYLSNALTSGDIFVGNASNVATGVAMSGLVAISNAGVTSIPLTSAHILVGNGSNVAAGVAVSGDVAISNAGVTTVQAGAITSSKLAANTIQYAQVTGITPTTLYSAGASLVAAPGAGNVIIPLSLTFNYIYSTAQYTSGGAIGVQYGSTVHAGGQACSATLAAATFNGYTANELFGLAPAIAGLTSASINAPLYLVAASNNFATGSGTITANVSYIIVSAS